MDQHTMSAGDGTAPGSTVQTGNQNATPWGGFRPSETLPKVLTRPPRGPRKPGDSFLLGCHQPLPPGSLPEEFILAIRDDSMAPMLFAGDDAIFSTQVLPEVGHVVLVGTIFGPDIRLLDVGPSLDSPFVGRALNAAYEDIDASTEQVWLIAALVGVDSLAEGGAA